MFREEAATLVLAQTREDERHLHRSVASLQRLLESSPTSDWIGTQLLAQAQQELRETEERLFAFLFILYRLPEAFLDLGYQRRFV